MSSVFEQKAPGIMRRLMEDFPVLRLEDAAAILGNIGHECGGFLLLQEQKPTVPGSRGGYGWAQWTGPRRRAYEAYCKRTGKDPASDAANYAYLWIELMGIEGSEKAAIGKTVKAATLQSKVIAFETAFLRAGIKHYASRLEYAQTALAAYKAQAKLGAVKPYPPIETTTPSPSPTTPKRKTLMDWFEGLIVNWTVGRVSSQLKDNPKMTNVISGVIRHVLTTFGGGLIGSGLIGDNEIGLIAGAVATLIGVAWSIVEKRLKA